jgi:hypothetical protein
MAGEIISESVGGIIPERRAASPGIGTAPSQELGFMTQAFFNLNKTRTGVSFDALMPAPIAKATIKNLDAAGVDHAIMAVPAADGMCRMQGDAPFNAVAVLTGPADHAGITITVDGKPIIVDEDRDRPLY